MTESPLRMWLHMTCRRFLEDGRWVYACGQCQTIWDVTKATQQGAKA